MRSKGVKILLLSILFLLAAVIPAQAEPQEEMQEAAQEGMQEATVSDASLEEIIEYEEPEGLVHLLPNFKWTEENRFLLSFRVINRTNVNVPETEVVLELSGTGENASADTEEFAFEESIHAAPEEYPGTAVIDGEGKTLRVLLTDFQPGAEYQFSVEGTAGAEADVPEVRASLVLRGYGLEHSTESLVEIPERLAAEEEPEEEVTILLIVQLVANGKEPVPAQFAYIYNESAEIYTDSVGEQAARRLHFLPYARESGSRSMSFPALAAAAVCVMLSTFSAMNFFLVKRAVRLNEAGKAGRRRKNISKTDC